MVTSLRTLLSNYWRTGNGPTNSFTPSSDLIVMKELPKWHQENNLIIFFENYGMYQITNLRGNTNKE